ncbi:FecR family protein [Kiritimatiella glycovorans]|uniref:FecR protein n=1 Tax=Kiritimatiella glycovorans TaxID=1307763 RepID=A0A0G3EJA4_9BACT|nr:FecR domain-containing protein [Kiritimatiella glycovorans]AKJ64860.1 FecR protein [Kiritimatiella glycovorans]
MKLWRAGMVLLAVALAGFTVEAAEVIGYVSKMQGEAEAISDGGTARELRPQSNVNLGDKIKTGRNAKLLIILRDGTEYRQGMNSVSVLDEYVFKPAKPEANKFRAKLDQGYFRVKTGRIPELNRDGFTLKTPRSVIAIRGSHVGVNVLDGFDHIFPFELSPGHEMLVNGRPLLQGNGLQVDDGGGTDPLEGDEFDAQGDENRQRTDPGGGGGRPPETPFPQQGFPDITNDDETQDEDDVTPS